MTLGASDAGCDAPDDAGRLAPCDGMQQQGAMKTSITWSPAAGLNVVSVERRERAWTVTVDSRQPTFCPGCGAQSKSRHSTYWRTLRDLSAQGAPVIVNARLGRWRCRNQLCDRRIFTERAPSLAAPFARRTARLAGIVRLLGHSAGGRPSERLMRRLGMPVSDTTILAGLRKHARARSESSASNAAPGDAVSRPASRWNDGEVGRLADRCARVWDLRDAAFCEDNTPRPGGGAERYVGALEQRADRRADQQTEDPQASHVWPRRC
jgi:hypothetical protein